MLNILLTRIDNRLIHGQVGVTWTTTLGANLLLVEIYKNLGDTQNVNKYNDLYLNEVKQTMK